MLLFLAVIFGGLIFAGVAMAAKYNLNVGLCTINSAERNCATSRQIKIDVAQAGNYTLKVTTKRGNDISKYECQDQESYYMIVNGQKTPVVNDPDRCEWQGTVKTQSVPGKYYLKKGVNVIKFYHAYTLEQAKSIESLVVTGLEINRIPDPINGACGSSAGKTFSAKPTSGLCSSGKASNISGNGPWTWKCYGSNGGRDVKCSADIVAPQCGSADGKTFSSKPTSGLCAKGTATSVNSGSNWTWQCVNGSKKVSCSANKYIPICGNNKVDAGEQCDDGNRTNGDGCSSTCKIEVPKIKIDKNDADNGDDKQRIQKGGTAKFKIKVTNTGSVALRDVVVRDAEAEDCHRGPIETQNIYPGNRFDPGESFTYTCSKSGVQNDFVNRALVIARSVTDKTVSDSDTSKVIVYTPTTCGDGVINQTSEQCDNGSDNGKVCVPGYGKTCSYCSNSCELITLYGGKCGDGKIEEGEQCDDGNNLNGDGCSSVCKIEIPQPSCGNGKVEENEQCDEGSDNGKVCVPGYGKTCSYCSSTCKTITLVGGKCGNGKLEDGEQCDDGNNLNGDGCSATCSVETPEPEPEPEPKPKKKKKCSGSIGNYIWLDADSDGIQDKDEKGIKDVRVKLKWAGEDGKWGNSDDEVWRTDTNKKGRYVFDDLCKGKYKLYVKDVDVKRYSKTYDPDGKKDNKTKITLHKDNDDHTKADFGYNEKKRTPATGSGTTALYLTGLISSVGWLSYRQYKGKVLFAKK